jgi:hypothetical protein
VDNISAPGVSPPGVFRRGTAQALVTGKCVFRFHPDRARFSLESLHPGETVDSVRDATGFDFDATGDIPATPDPTEAEHALLRGPVKAEMVETYPDFCARVWEATPRRPEGVHAFVAVSPFVLLLTLLWLAWRVLGILQPSFIPARVRLVRPGSDGQVLVELDTQEPGGGAGTALLERPSRRAPPAGGSG